jgi:hypothetical protein
VIETAVDFPIWVDPAAAGRTYMCEALGEACDAVRDFVATCPGAFPPIVINITDGMATDGNPEPVAKQLRSIRTDDGEALLFNVHISDKPVKPIELPVTAERLADGYARRLFRMSSILPDRLIAEARSMEFDVADGAKGFVFNGDLVSVIQFLDIGTRPC